MRSLGEIIYEQIKQCDELLDKRNAREINELAVHLYSVHRLNIKSIAVLGSSRNKSEFCEVELKKIRDILELYVAKEMIELEKEKYKGVSVSSISNSESKNESPITITDVAKVSDSGNSTNNNTNTNSVTLDLKAMFDSARKVIEEDEALGAEEVEEIIARINEIEEIGNEDVTRPQKWRKLKDCVNWATTKGVKVAMEVMPLIMKILETQNG